MSHNPVNHPARPIYRAIGGLTGLYLIVFGVLGAVQADGGELFARGDTEHVLGQGVNLGGGIVSAVLGLIIVIGTLIGRNIDTAIDKWLGYLFLALGLASLAVLRTDANFLGYTVVTCAVSMVIGLVLLMAGMYGRVGTDDEAEAWRKARLIL